MSEPILVSHKGKLVELHGDGRMVDHATGQPVRTEPDKRSLPPPKRWHSPYD